MLAGFLAGVSLFLPTASAQKKPIPMPSQQKVEEVAREYKTAQFEYDPRMTAQWLLTHHGISLREAPLDLTDTLRRIAPELDVKEDKIDEKSWEALRYGKYGLHYIDPMPIKDVVDEMDRYNLHGFEVIYKEMYIRLKWMVKGSGTERTLSESEKLRRKEAIITAWEVEKYRAERVSWENRRKKQIIE